VKLWLDDVRNPKSFESWEDAVWVTTPEEAIDYLDTGRITHLSLDNDLGLPDARDGYMVAQWLEERVHEDDDFMPPSVLNAHTANPIARQKIEAAYRAIRLRVKQR